MPVVSVAKVLVAAITGADLLLKFGMNNLIAGMDARGLR
jgi:hypothetical protein